MSYARSSQAGLATARIWHHVDAKNRPLGQLATRIAIALMGKYKPTYDPALDFGDYVVVTNCRHVFLTDKGRTERRYRWHTRYPGGFRDMAYRQFLEKHPCGTVRKAVYGMLPRTQLRKPRMDRLLLFPDSEHPYAANILKNHDGYDVTANVRQNADMPLDELERLLKESGPLFREKWVS